MNIQFGWYQVTQSLLPGLVLISPPSKSRTALERSLPSPPFTDRNQAQNAGQWLWLPSNIHWWHLFVKASSFNFYYLVFLKKNPKLFILFKFQVFLQIWRNFFSGLSKDPSYLFTTPILRGDNFSLLEYRHCNTLLYFLQFSFLFWYIKLCLISSLANSCFFIKWILS